MGCHHNQNSMNKKQRLSNGSWPGQADVIGLAESGPSSECATRKCITWSACREALVDRGVMSHLSLVF